MTYDQLKELTFPELISLLEKEIQRGKEMIPGCGDDWAPEAMGRIPPILLEIGDFEIRARFHHELPNRFDSLWAKFQGDVTEFSIEVNKLATVELNKYHELIYAVASKFPGESRHQTAMRYIREAEAVASYPPGASSDCACKDISVPGLAGKLYPIPDPRP